VDTAIEIPSDETERISGAHAWVDSVERFIALEKPPQATALFRWKRKITEFQPACVSHGEELLC
jgi:hypothetical protein